MSAQPQQSALPLKLDLPGSEHIKREIMWVGQIIEGSGKLYGVNDLTVLDRDGNLLPDLNIGDLLDQKRLQLLNSKKGLIDMRAEQ